MPDDTNLFRNGNHIYFYDDITDTAAIDLIKLLLETDADLNGKYNHAFSPTPQPIWLHLCSYGGFVFISFSLIDQIATLQSPVYSIIEGACASAATILSAGCAQRYITPNSFLMIHQISSAVWGTVTDLEDELFLGSMLMDQLTRFYKRHTHLKRKEIHALLKRNSWLNAQQALDFGFVDKILTP